MRLLVLQRGAEPEKTSRRLESLRQVTQKLLEAKLVLRLLCYNGSCHLLGKSTAMLIVKQPGWTSDMSQLGKRLTLCWGYAHLRDVRNCLMEAMISSMYCSYKWWPLHTWRQPPYMIASFLLLTPRCIPVHPSIPVETDKCTASYTCMIRAACRIVDWTYLTALAVWAGGVEPLRFSNWVNAVLTYLILCKYYID